MLDTLLEIFTKDTTLFKSPHYKDTYYYLISVRSRGDALIKFLKSGEINFDEVNEVNEEAGNVFYLLTDLLNDILDVYHSVGYPPTNIDSKIEEYFSEARGQLSTWQGIYNLRFLESALDDLYTKSKIMQTRFSNGYQYAECTDDLAEDYINFIQQTDSLKSLVDKYYNILASGDLLHFQNSVDAQAQRIENLRNKYSQVDGLLGTIKSVGNVLCGQYLY